MLPELKTTKYSFLPACTQEEDAELLADIQARGVLVPVHIDPDNNILDGHRRYQAARRAHLDNIPTYLVDTRQMSEDEVRGLVLSLNVNRRHLTQAQKRELIAQHLKQNPELSNRQIAGQVGVNHETVATVRGGLESTGGIRQMDKTLGKDGKERPSRRPTLISATSTKQISEAQEALKYIEQPREGTMSSHQLRSRVSAAKHNKRREEAAKLNPTPPDHIDIVHVRDFEELPITGGVNLIYTDPPYVKDFMPHWERLGKWAAEVLVEGGLFVTYSGQINLPEVMASLCKNLKYVWQLIITFVGPQKSTHKYKINCGYRPVLVFCKGDYKPERVIRDTFESDGPEKEYHPWQQALAPAKFWIEKLSKQGDLVCDPFVGSGTFALASMQLGRRFIGCDKDAATVKVALARLTEKNPD